MTATAAHDALFVPDGAHVVPTAFARGPWSPDALHGGPVAALLARAVEACEPDQAMHVARLTVELLRPVPLAALAVSATVTRPGRKVQVVEARIAADGRDVAWARALRIRLQAPGEASAGLPDPVASGPVPGRDPGAPPGPEDGYTSATLMSGNRAFHNEGAEVRYVVGSAVEPGPATVWVRLAVPVVPGEEPSPLQRVAGAADFGNGVSSELDFTAYIFINPDLSIHLQRSAIGEWICLDARTSIGTPGVGVAESALWDVHGPLGRSIQSLLIERRT